MRATYTINRTGSLHRTFRGPHKCGSPGVNEYHYNVEMEVSGFLSRADNEFVIDNNAIDDTIQHLFTDDKGRSCERMATDICEAVHKRMIAECPTWRVDRIKTSMTGTHGVAWLSCEWKRGGES